MSAFAMIPTWVAGSPISQAPLRVYLALARYARAGDRHAWPAIETLMADTGLARRSVFRALDTLQAARMITRVGASTAGTVIYALAAESPFAPQGGDSPVTGDRSVTGDSPVTPGVTHRSRGGDSPVTPGVTHRSPKQTIEQNKEQTREQTNRRARESERSSSQAECGEPQERHIKNDEPKAKNAPTGNEQAPATGLAADALHVIEKVLWPASKSLSDADTLSVVKIIGRHERTLRRDDVLRLAREWAEAWAGGKLDSLGSLSFTLTRGFVPARSGKTAQPVPLPGYRDTPWGPEGIIDLRTGKLAPADYDWGDPDEDFLAEMKSLRLTRIDL